MVTQVLHHSKWHCCPTTQIQQTVCCVVHQIRDWLPLVRLHEPLLFLFASLSIIQNFLSIDLEVERHVEITRPQKADHKKTITRSFFCFFPSCFKWKTCELRFDLVETRHLYICFLWSLFIFIYLLSCASTLTVTTFCQPVHRKNEN